MVIKRLWKGSGEARAVIKGARAPTTFARFNILVCKIQ